MLNRTADVGRSRVVYVELNREDRRVFPNTGQTKLNILWHKRT